MKSSFSILFILASFSMYGCGVTSFSGDTALRNNSKDIARNNFLSVHDDGGTNYLPEQGFENQNEKFTTVLSGIENFLNDKKRLTNSNSGPKKNILIYVHGGLNDYEDSLERANASFLDMKTENTYPIFITWRSNFISALGDHYFRVRGGKISKFAAISSPIYIIGDILSTIGNAPIAWFREADQMIETSLPAEEYIKVEEDLEAIKKLQLPENKNNAVFKEKGFDIAVAGEDDRKRWKYLRKGIWYLTAPFKIVTTPFVVTYGGPAWNNMRRRTSTMFMSEGDLTYHGNDGLIATEQEAPPSGATQIFLKELNQKLKRLRQEKEDFEVTLMGHSMGAIIINQALLAQPNLDIDNIVYMGSADTIQNYLNTTRIVLHYRRLIGEDVNIYNLHLHPENENREISAKGLAPSGSLLTWIDHSYGAPEYLLQRTAGRWSNMYHALNLIPYNDRKYHHFKIFGRTSSEGSPQKHGAFDDFKYWQKEFWTGKNVCRHPDCFIGDDSDFLRF